jgi:hypothetical protein
LFGLFSRKPKAESVDISRLKLGSKPSRPPASAVGGVIVSKSAAAIDPNSEEASLVVEDVVAFCNEMMNKGFFALSELPQKAVQAYYADYYLAQVNNGGHSQFVGNAGGRALRFMEHALEGLRAMGADAHFALLEQAFAWVREHPDEAAKQTGFNGGIAAELKALDAPFFVADKATPMANLSAKWILTWPELSIVDDSIVAEVRRRSAVLNPARGARLRLATLQGFHRQMTDRLQVGAGLACGAIQDGKLAMGPGAMMDIDGAILPVLSVRTETHGACLCVVTEDFAELYERPARNSLDPLEGVIGANFSGYKSPKPGRKLAHIPGKTITDVIESAVLRQGGGALHLLLAKTGAEVDGTVLSAMRLNNDASAQWFVLSPRRPLSIFSEQLGSTLVRMEGGAPRNPGAGHGRGNRRTCNECRGRRTRLAMVNFGRRQRA